MASKKITEARERKLKEAFARRRTKESRDSEGHGWNNETEHKAAAARMRTEDEPPRSSRGE